MIPRRVALVLVVLIVVAPARPAAAHPFGPPPTARLTASGNTITIDWLATPDDAVAIGELLGVMPEGSVALYRQEGATQVAPSSRDEARLSASPKLRDYLTERVTAVQDGAACSTEVPDIPNFVHEGVRINLRCPNEVTEATLRVTLLHDIHEAYRTVATGTDTQPAQAVFTVAAPEHTWTFGVEPSDTTSLTTAIGAGAIAGAAVSLVFLLLRRRSRRR